MASASSPCSSNGGDSCWSIVSSAVFVPTCASWLLFSSRHVFLSPPEFHLHIALSLSPPLAFPLSALSFSRLSPTSGSPPPPSTTLFAAFYHVPSQQTHKLALRFPCASHLFQFLETAATLGAHSSARLTHELSLFPFSSSSHLYRHADLDVNAVSSRALEMDPEPLPLEGAMQPDIPLATQGTAADCPVPWEVQDAPISTLRSPSSMAVQQNVTFERDVFAADSRNLDMGRNEPVLKKRRTPMTSLSRVFPATRCPSIPAASSISLGSASRLLGIYNDNALYRQMCDQGHVASEVEDRQQSSPRGIEDDLDNADDMDPSPIIPALKGASNRPLEQPLQQPGCELDTRAVDIFITHASKDSDSGDLRSELLGCLLDPSFRLLVERVEDLLGEIDNPANIDLVALADFLALRK